MSEKFLASDGPFIQDGFTPAMTELVSNTLKRGRNGQGYECEALFPDGHSIILEPSARQSIVDAVDAATSDSGLLPVKQVLARVLRNPDIQ